MGDVDMHAKRPEIISVQPISAGRRRIGVFASVDDTNDAFYAPIEAYEGRHRYDREFEWEPQEEKRLVRKVSTRLTVYYPVSLSTNPSSGRLENLRLGLCHVLCFAVGSK
jgi:hypothetical protein